jgi:hypothetical protein
VEVSPAETILAVKQRAAAAAVDEAGGEPGAMPRLYDINDATELEDDQTVGECGLGVQTPVRVRD